MNGSASTIPGRALTATESEDSILLFFRVCGERRGGAQTLDALLRGCPQSALSPDLVPLAYQDSVTQLQVTSSGTVPSMPPVSNPSHRWTSSVP